MYRQALKNMYKAAAAEGQEQPAGDPSFVDKLQQGAAKAGDYFKDKGQQALDWTQNTLNDAKALTAEQAAALAAALSNKQNYGALAALGAAGVGGLGGAALGDNAEERIINALTGAAGGAGAVGGARGAMELLEGNVDPLLAAGIGGVTGGIGSGALARLLAKTLMK
jgi:hypothetical protein